MGSAKLEMGGLRSPDLSGQFGAQLLYASSRMAPT
jgi:hypothetical protein